MKRMALDIRDRMHPDMEEYLSNYGWHFSKKAFKEAVRGLLKKTPSGKMEEVEPWDKERVDEFLKQYGVKLENDVLYDAAYVCNMGRADYYLSSIPDEAHLAKYVKDTVDDVDGSDELPFRYWCQKRVAMGMPIEWEDMM